MGFSLFPQRIDVFVHHADTDHKLDAILGKVNHIMARVDEMNAELVEINATTNEMAADLDDLIARQQAGGLSDAESVEVTAKLVALRDNLKALAAKHTPGAPPV